MKKKMKGKYFQNRELDFMIAFLLTTVFFNKFPLKVYFEACHLFFQIVEFCPNKGEISNRLILVTKNGKNTEQIIIDFINYREKVIAYVSPTIKTFLTHFKKA